MPRLISLLLILAVIALAAVLLFLSLSRRAPRPVALDVRWSVLCKTPGPNVAHEGPVISPDSRHVVFFFFRGEKGNVMSLDNATSEMPGAVVRGSGRFSPDSKHFAWIARKAKKSCVVLDGVAGDEYDGVNEGYRLNFSPDSKHLAYLAHRGRKSVVVLDGKPLGEYEEMPDYQSFVFSPDSSRFAYAEERSPQQCFVVVNGVEGPTFKRVGSPVFSPDSKRMAYLASGAPTLAGDTGLVVDNEVVAKNVAGFDPNRKQVLFSPDSKRIAMVLDTGRCRVWLDGEVGKEYNHILPSSLVFSPDSKRLAFQASIGGKETVVVDGVEGDGYDHVESGPVFSPDSKHVAFTAMRGDDLYLVTDGVASVPARQWPGCAPIFSPDSRHVACLMADPATHRSFILMDGVRTRMRDNILYNSPAFSLDSKHFAFIVETGPRKFIEVDSLQTPGTFDEPIKDAGLKFDSNDSLHTLVYRGRWTSPRDVVLVEVRIVER